MRIWLHVLQSLMAIEHNMGTPEALFHLESVFSSLNCVSLGMTLIGIFWCQSEVGWHWFEHLQTAPNCMLQQTQHLSHNWLQCNRPTSSRGDDKFGLSYANRPHLPSVQSCRALHFHQDTLVYSSCPLKYDKHPQLEVLCWMKSCIILLPFCLNTWIYGVGKSSDDEYWSLYLTFKLLEAQGRVWHWLVKAWQQTGKTPTWSCSSSTERQNMDFFFLLGGVVVVFVFPFLIRNLSYSLCESGLLH